jgi:hypothetical protein
MRDRGYSYLTPSVLIHTIISEIKKQGFGHYLLPEFHLTEKLKPIPKGIKYN